MEQFRGVQNENLSHKLDCVVRSTAQTTILSNKKPTPHKYLYKKKKITVIFRSFVHMLLLSCWLWMVLVGCGFVRLFVLGGVVSVSVLIVHNEATKQVVSVGPLVVAVLVVDGTRKEKTSKKRGLNAVTSERTSARATNE